MGRNDESVIQASIVAYVRAVAPECLIAAVPNGGLRTPAEAAKFKWTGVVAGIPDLFVMMPGGRVGFLEVKTAGGALSKAQLAICARMTELAVPFAVVRGVDETRAALQSWGCPMREARAA